MALLRDQVGLPRPKSRNYADANGMRLGRLPVPWSSDYNGRYNTGLAVLDTDKQSQCEGLTHCLVCGDKLERRFWSVWDDLKNHFLEFGMHPKCAKMTASFCPHIRDAIRAGKMKLYSVTREEVYVVDHTLYLSDQTRGHKRHMFTPKGG